ncbi:MAG: hypothetical protein LBI57_03420 [Helicobacteraceae bacterium]|jgi:hypothetical protein|nr:hypothetical protein [Helicobacteraceae bacterium]
MIEELSKKILAALKKAGIEAITAKRPVIDQIGNFLVFEAQEINKAPAPNKARFSLYIARSDLEGKEGAYGVIDKLYAFANVKGGGITFGGFTREKSEGLYIYKATVTAVAPKS